MSLYGCPAPTTPELPPRIVVERKLAKEGLKRQDLGRDKFLEKVWQWKEEYGSTIIKQLKKLGASCDWERVRFTMDEEYSQAVRGGLCQAVG